MDDEEYEKYEDAQRLRDITELAQRLWPHAMLEPIERWGTKDTGWGIRSSRGSTCIQIMGPRALDGLEAALIVMVHSKETTLTALERLRHPLQDAFVDEQTSAPMTEGQLKIIEKIMMGPEHEDE